MNRRLVNLLSLATLAVTAGCMSAPKDLDLSLTRTSVDKKYVVTLRPPAVPPAISQLHAWQVSVATPAGLPVAQARIQVDGGMPQHGHGLPTRPRVTQELSAGTYLMEGMKFSMTGWWEIKLVIDGSQGADSLTFNTVVAQPGAGR